MWHLLLIVSLTFAFIPDKVLDFGYVLFARSPRTPSTSTS